MLSCTAVLSAVEPTNKSWCKPAKYLQPLFSYAIKTSIRSVVLQIFSTKKKEVGERNKECTKRAKGAKSEYLTDALVI
jgi:hypothetical protein